MTNAEGKDCNVFHGDYTGLAVGSDNRINVVWTGLNRLATSPQIDAYTGAAARRLRTGRDVRPPLVRFVAHR